MKSITEVARALVCHINISLRSGFLHTALIKTGRRLLPMVQCEIRIMIIIITKRQLYLRLCGFGRPLLVDVLSLDFLWDSLASEGQLVMDW